MYIDNAYVFLFDADLASKIDVFYSDACTAQLFKKFIPCYETGLTRFLKGDIVLTGFSEVFSELMFSEKSKGRTMSHNLRRHADIIHELIDALRVKKNSINENSLALKLARSNIYAINILPLKSEAAEEIDRFLQSFRPYIGYAEIDAGNPFLKIVFFDYLMPMIIYDDNTIYTDVNFGYKEFIERLQIEFPKVNACMMESEDFNAAIYTNYEIRDLSEKGNISKDKMIDDSWKSHRNKTLEKTYQAFANDDEDLYIDSNLPEGFSEIEIPKQKLTEYALNLEHPKGKDKAKQFKNHLDISVDDWKFLFLQIIEGIKTFNINEIKKTPHGIQYDVPMQIQGKNGKIKTTITSWIVENGKPARLTSIYIPDKKKQIQDKDQKEFIIIEECIEQKWKKIFSLAKIEGKKAFDNFSPNPIQVGQDVIWDGMCGRACILIKDARTRLSKWLLSNNIAHKSFGSGVTISFRESSQSYEKYVAYANAYAYILRLNDIDCEIKDWID